MFPVGFFANKFEMFLFLCLALKKLIRTQILKKNKRLQRPQREIKTLLAFQLDQAFVFV
jgi:hypothetical protein